MIGTSTAEYFFIRSCILFLHNIAPISILYSILLLVSQVLHLSSHGKIPYLIHVWLIAESIFFTTIYIPLKYALSQSTALHTPLSADERYSLFKRCNATVTNMENYLSRWLLVPEFESVKRGDVKNFIRWSLFGPESTLDPAPQYEEEIEIYTAEIENHIGRDLPLGRTDVKGGKCLGELLNESSGSHRSLLWYTCVFVVDAVAYSKMLHTGFHFHCNTFWQLFTIFPCRPIALLTAHKTPTRHLTYWHRQHTSKKRLPILFIHGIGVGMFPYTDFLRELDMELNTEAIDDGEVGIIALEIMSISSRISHPALEKDMMVNEIMEIMRYHGWGKFVLVSHSYGSVIAAHLLKSEKFAALVGPTVFIDPVAFLLHLPDVTYNFIVRQPARANEYQLWYFGSKDIGVAHTLARRFSWNDNIIWKEELWFNDESRKITVVLSGQDLIVDTEAVGQYLVASDIQAQKEATQEWKHQPWLGSGLEILWFEQLDHAQVFESEKTRRPVIKAISSYSNSS